jgi:hypothetical protein
VDLAIWQALLDEHPELAGFEPEVEALLVRRTPRQQDYFRVSIDHCYELTGALRTLRAPLGMPNPEILDDFFAGLERGAKGGSRSVSRKCEP